MVPENKQGNNFPNYGNSQPQNHVIPQSADKSQNIQNSQQAREYAPDKQFSNQAQIYYNNGTPLRNLQPFEPSVTPIAQNMHPQHQIPQMTPYHHLQNVPHGLHNQMYINSPMYPQNYNPNLQQQFRMPPQMNPRVINPNMLSYNQNQFHQAQMMNSNQQMLQTPLPEKLNKPKNTTTTTNTTTNTNKTPAFPQNQRNSSTPFTSNNSDSVTQYKAKRRKKQNTTKAEILDLEDSLPMGDEFDKYNLRDIAIARYQRYHDYIASIFSPLTIDSKHQPDFYSSLDKDKMMASLKKLETEIENLKSKHSESKESNQKISLLYSELIESLKSADSEKVTFQYYIALHLYSYYPFFPLSEIISFIISVY
ncbi:hypothetical protein AYI68_g1197 [Smittium mucronatum]|uniref:Uncharacterized protein n=1 Tax=Smittium mucronatum TaxID=133383 RepID=A0A1R0H687_9FUNG|nr:hypothetical protein AYI68_g5404 [Smittium mucronatum]OLY84633.1 hypothetical protein AYI68_g1197 [Smittium mucronatum]